MCRRAHRVGALQLPRSLDTTLKAFPASAALCRHAARGPPAKHSVTDAELPVLFCMRLCVPARCRTHATMDVDDLDGGLVKTLSAETLSTLRHATCLPPLCCAMGEDFNRVCLIAARRSGDQLAHKKSRKSLNQAVELILLSWQPSAGEIQMLKEMGMGSSAGEIQMLKEMRLLPGGSATVGSVGDRRRIEQRRRDNISLQGTCQLLHPATPYYPSLRVEEIPC